MTSGQGYELAEIEMIGDGAGAQTVAGGDVRVMRAEAVEREGVRDGAESAGVRRDERHGSDGGGEVWCSGEVKVGWMDGWMDGVVWDGVLERQGMSRRGRCVNQRR